MIQKTEHLFDGNFSCIYNTTCILMDNTKPNKKYEMPSVKHSYGQYVV